MASKDVLKEAIKAFDGTAIIVSHDREFLDGLVTKVYEFGGGQVREHLGGIYDFLQSRKIDELSELGKSVATKMEPAATTQPAKTGNASYAEHKEQQKRLKRAEKAVKESETKIEKMEQRLKELDEQLMIPENASDMTLVTEYTSTKKALDEEVERWEQLSEELASLSA
jgi:ATP-binding cassette subfamily F protein 3